MRGGFIDTDDSVSHHKQIGRTVCAGRRFNNEIDIYSFLGGRAGEVYSGRDAVKISAERSLGVIARCRPGYGVDLEVFLMCNSPSSEIAQGQAEVHGKGPANR